MNDYIVAEVFVQITCDVLNKYHIHLFKLCTNKPTNQPNRQTYKQTNKQTDVYNQPNKHTNKPRKDEQGVLDR